MVLFYQLSKVTLYAIDEINIIESTVPQTEFQISVQRFHHALAHFTFIIIIYRHFGNETLTLKSDKDAISSSNSWVAEEARGANDWFELVIICRSISLVPSEMCKQIIIWNLVIKDHLFWTEWKVSYQGMIDWLVSYVLFSFHEL